MEEFEQKITKETKKNARRRLIRIRNREVGKSTARAVAMDRHHGMATVNDQGFLESSAAVVFLRSLRFLLFKISEFHDVPANRPTSCLR
jgi:hypothetical protein